MSLATFLLLLHPADVINSAGASQTVTVSVQSYQLAVWNRAGQFAVEPGNFVVRVGTSDTTFLTTNLTVSA